MSYSKSSPGNFGFILVAALIYIIGVIGITMAKNVPLNNMLDAFNLANATSEEMHTLRLNFERPWNNWNLVRTLANLAAFLLLLLGYRK